jgi:hypothetical protein
MSLAVRILLVGIIVGVLAIPSSAQVTSVPNPSSSMIALPDAPQPAFNQDAVSLRNTPRHLLEDQKAIWTSPARLTLRDLRWITPLAVATGVSVATDHHTMSSVVSHDASFNQTSIDASNGLTGGLVALPVALYGLGVVRGNEHAQDTGLLGGEALVDSLVVQEGLKLIFWRERPSLDNARGLFFQGSAGSDSSFPSNHSVLAWSSAAVIASEYPSRWAQVGVYSLATGVSLTRVMGQQHFPTDALIGSAAGWLIGHYVVRTHRKIHSH